MFLVVSRRRHNDQHRHGVYLLRADLGKVSVVIPISSTGPFFSLILAAIFLRDVEQVTLRIVISAAMIVGGVVLLTLWK